MSTPKKIRISDKHLAQLEEHAAADGIKSSTKMLAVILDLYFSDMVVTDRDEALAIQKAIVDEGKALGVLPTRTPQDCLRDIRELEANQENELAVCQDREYANQIRANYQAKIQPLWDEYHELKQA